MDDQTLWMSYIEVEIAFKLYLGREKDIENAKHLYILFKQALDKEMLNTLLSMLKVEDTVRRYLE